HGNAGRSGEAREPGEALVARRDIFVLVAVGARQDQARKPAPGQFGAQRRDPRRRLRRRGIIERLKAGLEHRRSIPWGADSWGEPNLWAGGGRRNRARFYDGG